MRRRRRQVTNILLGAIIGALVASIAISAGGLAGAIVVIVVCIAGPVVLRLWMRHVIPRRSYERMLESLDPSIGPPVDTRPIELQVATRWATAMNQLDRRAAGELLTDDFVYRYPQRGREITGRTYVGAMRFTKMIMRSWDLTLDEVVGEPDAPGVCWVRMSQVCRPYSGPVMDSTWWEQWTLEPSRERLRDATFLGITRVN